MATKNPRLNITFEPDTILLLNSLAQHEKKSVASITKELVLEALELREDMILSAIAEERDQPGAQTISHDEIWK